MIILPNAGAILNPKEFLFTFNGIIQTILVAFSMKTSRASSGMLFYENDAFKCLKTAENTNSICITCTIFPGLVELVFSPNQPGVDQKHEL